MYKNERGETTVFLNKLQTVAGLGGLLLAAVIPASADVNNGSFLLGEGLGGTNAPGSYSGINYDSSLYLQPGYCNTCSITGWAVTGSVDWIGTYWAAPNAAGQAGGHSVDLDGLEQPGAISQTVTGLTVGNKYDLSFYVNGNSDGTPLPNKNLLVSISNATPSSEGYTPVAYVPANQSLNLWAQEDYVFIANASSVTVEFQSLDNEGSLGTYPGTSFGPVIAGVSLTPEPGFYGVLALSLIGLCFVAARRRSAA
jgi:hypothetical protein